LHVATACVAAGARRSRAISGMGARRIGVETWESA
jgi:hypothetical protein